jgi:hypothetical protein
MRNDAEYQSGLRNMDEHVRTKKGFEPPIQKSERAKDVCDPKPFVTDVDPGDEDKRSESPR